MPEITVFEDKREPGDWRVQYGDDDGGCYVTIFAGPLLVALIARHVKTARRDLMSQMAQLDVLTSGRRKPGRPSGRPHALLGRKIAPKYRGPKGETWAGRGMTPLWLRDELKRGRKLEHFAVGKRGRPTKTAAKGRRKKASR